MNRELYVTVSFDRQTAMPHVGTQCPELEPTRYWLHIVERSKAVKTLNACESQERSQRNIERA